MMTILQRNITANKNGLPKMEARELDWNRVEKLKESFNAPFDYIIGSGN
jgi:hypothetical protein